MIKFTIIFVVVYLALKAFTKMYVNGLSPIDKLRIARNNLTKKEQLWFSGLGIMQILGIVFEVISLIIIVVSYL